MRTKDVLPICISAALPGCGHIAAGRPARGLVVLFLFGFAVDGVAYAKAQSLLPPGNTVPGIYYVALIGGLALWGFAVADTAAAALRARRAEGQAAVATERIRQALGAYLGGDYRAATDALRAALRIHREDPDALFYLGAVLAVAGEPRAARRALRRCLRHDSAAKWHDEAHAHLRALEATPAAPAARESAGPADDSGQEEHVDPTA